MAARRLGPEEIAAAWRRLWASWILVFVPGLLALVAQGVAHLLTRAPPLSQSFVPATGVSLGFGVAGAIYAALTMWLMNSGRALAHEPPLMSDTTRATVWGMGLGVWFMVLLLGSRYVAGAVNLVVGDVAVVQASVQGKTHNMGRGCRDVLEIAVDGVPEGERVCVTERQWDRTLPGAGVRVVTVSSALGRQDGVTIGAMQRATGGAR